MSTKCSSGAVPGGVLPNPSLLPVKPSAAGSPGRGGARERSQFSPSGGNGDKRTLRRRAAGGKVTRRTQAAKFPLRITNSFQNLPPHPPLCAHWGTFPQDVNQLIHVQGEGLYKKQKTPGSAKTAGTGGAFIV